MKEQYQPTLETKESKIESHLSPEETRIIEQVFENEVKRVKSHFEEMVVRIEQSVPYDEAIQDVYSDKNWKQHESIKTVVSYQGPLGKQFSFVFDNSYGIRNLLSTLELGDSNLGSLDELKIVILKRAMAEDERIKKFVDAAIYAVKKLNQIENRYITVDIKELEKKYGIEEVRKMNADSHPEYFERKQSGQRMEELIYGKKDSTE